MINLKFMLYENLQFIDYMVQNNYDKDIISEYIKYNLDMIQNDQDVKIEKLKDLFELQKGGNQND